MLPAMRSEKDKMLAGELYDPRDPRLSAERRRARLLIKALNDSGDDEGTSARGSSRN
jgi:maltose O-acetyltransferase